MSYLSVAWLVSVPLVLGVLFARGVHPGEVFVTKSRFELSWLICAVGLVSAAAALDVFGLPLPYLAQAMMAGEALLFSFIWFRTIRIAPNALAEVERCES